MKYKVIYNTFVEGNGRRFVTTHKTINEAMEIKDGIVETCLASHPIVDFIKDDSEYESGRNSYSFFLNHLTKELSVEVIIKEDGE